LVKFVTLIPNTGSFEQGLKQSYFFSLNFRSLSKTWIGWFCVKRGQ